MTRPTIVLIAAVAAKGIIGRDGAIPWDIPEELAHFKRTTMGHPVVMGRKTFERILEIRGEPLPGRANIVLSRGAPAFPTRVTVVSSVEEAIAAGASEDDRLFVAGGAAVYEAFLPWVDRMIISEIPGDYRGDTRFPRWNRDEFDVVARRPETGFTVVRYDRRELPE